MVTALLMGMNKKKSTRLLAEMSEMFLMMLMFVSCLRYCWIKAITWCISKHFFSFSLLFSLQDIITGISLMFPLPVCRYVKFCARVTECDLYWLISIKPISSYRNTSAVVTAVERYALSQLPWLFFYLPPQIAFNVFLAASDGVES